MTRLRDRALAMFLLVAAPCVAAVPSGVGLDAELSQAEQASLALPEGFRDRLLLRLRLPAGQDPREQAAALVALDAVARRARVVVALAPEDASAVDVRDGAGVDAWAERVATLVEAGTGRVAAWEIPASPGRADEEQAFFIKRTALAIKGVDRRALVLASEPRAWPAGSLSEAVAPFVDGLAVPAGVPQVAGALRTGVPAAADGGAWAAAVNAFAAGDLAVTVDAPLADPSRTARSLQALLEAIPEDASPSGNEPVVSFPAEVPVSAIELIVGSDLSTRVVFAPTLEGRLPGARMVATFTDEPRGLQVLDPESAPSSPRVVRRGSAWLAEVPLVRRPLVLSWERARSDDEMEEQVAVSREIEPTVEEILAKHFAAQAARDRRLESYVADLSTEMRYELGASGQTFDVRIEGRYYFGPGVREIENLRWFVNGAKFERKNGRMPEIPLMQPDKVQVMPLELRLDKSYEYVLHGKEDRGGRPAWKVSFKPSAADVNAYAGTVWIDRQTHDRLAVDLVQTRLEPPVLTNEQMDAYGPVLAEDGEHWMVRESRIHRTVSLLGAAVGIQMRLLFSNFRVNAPDFEQQHAQALRSPHQMLRDTDEGLKYLRPTDGGGREVAESSTRKIFVAAGARYDDAYEHVLPLAGVNWLDYDAFGKGLQLNVFAAGAINTLSIADPSLFGSRVTLGADVFLPFIRRRDRNAVPGSGVAEGEIVNSRIPTVALEASRPMGRHARIAGTLAVERQDWSRNDETDATFVPPADAWVGALGVKADVHRKGWDSRIWISRSARSEWRAWGRDAGAGPPPVDEASKGFWKWGANLDKTWPVAKLQTFGFDAQYLGGSGLDRFSQHEFSAFGGTRLPGFDGSGIHFDQAALLRLSYGVDVAGAFGAQVQVGYGRTWNRSLPAAVRDEFGEDSDQLGIALIGTVPGPWGTLIRFDLGTALWSSDYESAEGNLIAQFIVLKLLGK